MKKKTKKSPNPLQFPETLEQLTAWQPYKNCVFILTGAISGLAVTCSVSQIRESLRVSADLSEWANKAAGKKRLPRVTVSPRQVNKTAGAVLSGITASLTALYGGQATAKTLRLLASHDVFWGMLKKEQAAHRKRWSRGTSEQKRLVKTGLGSLRDLALKYEQQHPRPSDYEFFSGKSP